MSGKRKQSVADKKDLILDAAERIMREDGYAAVTTRRVAEGTGSKSMPIHYHFGSMDDLFVALYRRSDQNYFVQLVQALSSDDPLQELWKLGQDPTDRGLVVEYLALANHRPSVRDEVSRSAERARAISTALVTTATGNAQIELPSVSPATFTFLIEAICRSLVSDRRLGTSLNHDEVIAFVEQALSQARPAK